jgi:hypothetical protein
MLLIRWMETRQGGSEECGGRLESKMQSDDWVKLCMRTEETACLMALLGVSSPGLAKGWMKSDLILNAIRDSPRLLHSRSFLTVFVCWHLH